MSQRLGGPARLIWSLIQAGQGTTITANGNSGAWPSPPYDPGKYNAMTPFDLRDVEDVWISAFAAGVSGTTPGLTVSLNVFDQLGNAYQITSLAQPVRELARDAVR
jgi:hypothetical protein